MGLSELDLEAITLYERGMEKEQLGLVSDAVSFYKAAEQINQHVEKLYRQERVPEAIQQLKDKHGKNVAHKVDEAAVRKIDVEKLLALWEHAEAHAPKVDDPDTWNDGDIVVKIGKLAVNGPSEEVAPLIHLPGEVWVHVLSHLIDTDPELWFHFGMTCKRHAYFAFGSSTLWKKLCYLIYPHQIYEDRTLNDPKILYTRCGSSWKKVLRQTPYVMFSGCYISVVNRYTSGGRSEFSLSWSNPVKTSTYYRYLRFYPDGLCLMALTALDPTVVVHQLLRKNTNKCIMENKEVSIHFDPAIHPHKIYIGAWKISADGELQIRLYEGSVSYNTFYYYFKIKNLGSRPNSKLSWVRLFAVEKDLNGNDSPTGEEVDFSWENEKPFTFSRVKSYTNEL